MDLKKFKEKVKKPFKIEYEPKIEAKGYRMMLGNDKACTTLEVRLQPLENLPDPIAEDLFNKIKNEILPSTIETDYGKIQVNVKYVGKIVSYFGD